MGDLDGSVSIVTGASQGIGAGIARVLAEEGSRVAITGRNEQRVQAVAQQVIDAGGDAIGLLHEATSAASCAEVVSNAKDAFGPIDLLVNNAGISQRISFAEIDETTWDAMLSANLKSIYLMSRCVLPEMLDRKKGRIINVASLAGKAGGSPLASHYVASKFAVIGFTQALAAEVAPHQVLVNAVCPGVIRTDMWEQELREISLDEGLSVEQAWDDIVASIPLMRPQESNDIGYVVAFLASAKACNITGESINVNGGQLMD